MVYINSYISERSSVELDMVQAIAKTGTGRMDKSKINMLVLREKYCHCQTGAFSKLRAIHSSKISKIWLKEQVNEKENSTIFTDFSPDCA